MKNLIIFSIALLMGTALGAQTEPIIVKPASGEPTFIIDSTSGPINLIATENIRFLHGTHIQNGSYFRAYLTDDPYVPPLPDNGIAGENYIYTRTYQREMQSADDIIENGDVLEQITYFDGLGRPMQNIAIKASPDLKDIVTHIEYDDFGRMVEEFLPYEADGTLGSLRTGNLRLATQTFNKSHYPDNFTGVSVENTNPFSKNKFEPSPLNRILKQAAPGKSWELGSGHEIEFGYGTNTVADNVHLFEVTTAFANNTYTPTLKNTGVTTYKYYGAGELYKNITKDENHDGISSKLHTTEEFTDKQGRVILKRTYALMGNPAIEEPHDTYYVYDDYGNLTYVIPPKVTITPVGSTSEGLTPTELSELCYQYKYDHRNRLVEKKIPGKGTATDWESIVYNKLDQPIMTQDPNLKANGEWLFTKYDVFGRVAYTGKVTDARSRQAIQADADAFTGTLWTNVDINNPAAGIYDNAGYPQNNISEKYIINCYDQEFFIDYEAYLPTGISKTSNLKGLLTKTYNVVLDTDEAGYDFTEFVYDAKGREIVSFRRFSLANGDTTVQNLLSETTYDFAGKALENKNSILFGFVATVPSVSTIDHFEYDHASRLVKQEQELAGSTELIAHNTYDAIGQLVKKKVGNTEANPLQEVDYKYNVRGWLKDVNDPSSLGTDLFAFGIDYNETGHGQAALYNGNISKATWRTANDNVPRGYSYFYDAMNRLTGTNNGGNYEVSGITYDKNGNIQTLNRNGFQNTSNYQNMDVLDYDYGPGNKLLKVIDTGNKSYGFKDGTNTNEDYVYDANGNMELDRNKGITSITYNHLNLPKELAINDGGTNNGTISYIYDATGVKLQKNVLKSGNTVTTNYVGNYVYQDNGSGNKLQFFSHAEGYVEPKDPEDLSQGFDYVFQYKDHLGNVRLSYSDRNNDGSITVSSDPMVTEIVEENNYYPFGLKHKGYNNVVNSSNVALDFKYNGVELEESLGLDLYEMAFRQYDPAIGRFTAIDPVTHYYQSTYTAFDDNPIFYADPSGTTSTAEWMEKNGISQSEVTTVYSAEDENCCGDGDDNPILGKITGYLAELFGVGTNDEQELAENGRVEEAQDLSQRRKQVRDDFVEDGEKVIDAFGLLPGAFLAQSQMEAEKGNYAAAGIIFAFGFVDQASGGGKGTAAKTGWKTFGSFSAFKRYFGAAGKGKAWHHIVEQNPANIGKFGEKFIHNTLNLVKLPHGKGTIHAKISGHYSSKQPFTNGKTVRQWLNTKSYKEQYNYGIKMLKQFGWE